MHGTAEASSASEHVYPAVAAAANDHQISDRVTRREFAELSIARMKVSSLEYCWMMLSSMFTRTLRKTKQGCSV